jgi:hypothetical protein
MIRSHVSGLALGCLLALGGCGSGKEPKCWGDACKNQGTGASPAADDDDDDRDAAADADAADDDDDDTTATPTRRLLWSITDSGGRLTAVDTQSHTEEFHVRVAEGGNAMAWSFKVANDYAWVWRNDGVLDVVNLATEKVAASIALSTLDPETAEDVWGTGVTLGDGCVYVLTDNSGNLARVDAATLAVSKTTQIEGGIPQKNSVMYDGTSLWVMFDEGSRLVQADAVTLETTNSITLGEGSNPPVGRLVHVTDEAVWLVDTNTNDLIRVDKAALTPSVVDNLSDLDRFPELSDMGIGTNEADFFLMLLKSNRVVRFDGATGNRGPVYDLANRGGINTMAVAKDRLYVLTDASSRTEVLEIDIETGSTLQTFTLLRPAQWPLVASDLPVTP